MNYNELRKILLYSSDNNNADYVKAILSVELNIENKKMLDFMYDKYMENDNINLLDDFFYEAENEYDNEMEVNLNDIL